jgi:hypothetical protein
MTNTIIIIIKMDNLKTHLQIKMMISKGLFFKIKLTLMINLMIIIKNNMAALIIILIRINNNLIILSKLLLPKILQF